MNRQTERCSLPASCRTLPTSHNPNHNTQRNFTMSPTVLCPSLTSTTRIHYWYDGTEYSTTVPSTTGQYKRRCSTWHAPDPDVFPPTFVHTPLMLSMYAIMLSCMLLSFMERSRYFKFGVLRMVFYIVQSQCHSAHSWFFKMY